VEIYVTVFGVDPDSSRIDQAGNVRAMAVFECELSPVVIYHLSLAVPCHVW
jgi:hypothetical protein